MWAVTTRNDASPLRPYASISTVVTDEEGVKTESAYICPFRVFGGTRTRCHDLCPQFPEARRSMGNGMGKKIFGARLINTSNVQVSDFITAPRRMQARTGYFVGPIYGISWHDNKTCGTACVASCGPLFGLRL